jgi:hypothetical protein
MHDKTHASLMAFRVDVVESHHIHTLIAEITLVRKGEVLGHGNYNT